MRRSDGIDEAGGRLGPLTVSAIFLALAAMTSLYRKIREHVAAEEQIDVFARTFRQQDAHGAGGGA